MLFSDLMKRGDYYGGSPAYNGENQILAIQPRQISPQQEASDFQYFDENGGT